MILQLTPEEIYKLNYCWKFWARDNQLPPKGDWSTWIALAGRGFGKSRMGAEFIRHKVIHEGAKFGSIIGATMDDALSVMVEGNSGILACCPPEERPRLVKGAQNRLVWGAPYHAIVRVFSAQEPDRLRGWQTQVVWADELAAYEYPEAIWKEISLTNRLGLLPQALITTTPRPIPIIRRLYDDPTVMKSMGSTMDNADNLAGSFMNEVTRLYEGTRFGKQELYGQILDEIRGSLWKRDQLEYTRVTKAPNLQRIVVAVDPAVSTEKGSDETGIIVAGVGYDGRGYVLADKSGKYTPNEWGQLVVNLYHEHNADRIVAEANNGGALVENNIRTVDKTVSYKKVHASQGKAPRAEPIAALYEQSKVSHVGFFSELETQMCTWEPYGNPDIEGGPKKRRSVKSPDRVDALVWAFAELMLGIYNTPTSSGTPLLDE